MAEGRSSGAIGAAVLLLAVLGGGALVLDVGGLQSRLFAESTAARPMPDAKLPEPAAGTPLVTGPVTPAWYLGASGYDGAELERQSSRATMVLYVTRKKCDLCRQFEKQLLGAPEVKSFLANVVKVRIDPDDGDREQKLVRRFGADDAPAFVVVPQRGPAHLVPLGRDRLLSPHQLVAYCR